MDWKELHKTKPYDFYILPNIIRVIRSRRMKLTGYVACKGERRGVYRVWCGNLRERDLLGDLVVDGY